MVLLVYQFHFLNYVALVLTLIAQKKPQTNLKKQAFKPKRIEELEIVLDYAKRIRNIRSNLRLNQDQFAQKLNEKPSLLRRIEAGKVEPPSN
ncbi:unnamed protein product [marine sediment metagenome]|uniref:HTH cro/C1-type domain-containing protein n=1 Tax=marine sediment metagenome TaxID=412755 RepID=X1BGL8_9ZZZZ